MSLRKLRSFLSRFRAGKSSCNFDPDWYLASYPDAAKAGIDPIDHYITLGKRAGHYPTPTAAEKAKLSILARSYHLDKPAPMSALDDKLQTHSDTKPPANLNSAEYWENRYRGGGNSGAGSYGRLAEFKAGIVNSFVQENNISSVIEFGCGDGAQLALSNYSSYLGFDVVDECIEMCRSKFADDSTKAFSNTSAWNYETADLTLSLDVIYHLIEDNVFHDYMRRLFASANRYVIIYSSNSDDRYPASHILHRRFTDWINIYHADFNLIRFIPNAYPLIDNDKLQSFADFFIFEKQPPRQHTLPGHLVVSLTSYTKRFPTLELTLRRILHQNVRPDETVLWLTEGDRNELPEGVLFLQKLGLTIRTTKDIGSYKKIIPALENYPDSFILTFDDDIAYPLSAIESLVSYYQSPKEILCRRAHKITYNENNSPRLYNKWRFDVSDSDQDLFATGCLGILYPPHSLATEVLNETAFMSLAPFADDIWLFWMERIAGSTVRKVGPRYDQEMWPGCHEQGLWANYNENGGNDLVIKALTERYGSVF